MLDQLKEVIEKQDQARSYRKKGDALRKAKQEDAACEAYRVGVSVLNEALETLSPELAQLLAKNPPLSINEEGVVHELIETFGARGGMLQRLGLLKEALDSYSKGAVLEERFALPSIYNRLNALKFSLLTREKQVSELEPQIRELASHIKTVLNANKSMSDSGWAWADLGDCLTLLGSSEEAGMAYSSFISKAEIKSPERTLDVLKQIALKLKQEPADPDAQRLQAAIDILQSRLTV